MNNWTDKRVIVTGAASGIGRATAMRFRADGAHVTAIDRNDPGDAAQIWHSADLSDPAAIRMLSLTGTYAALVNAAGLPPRPGTEAQILRVNFLALRELTMRLLEHLAPASGIVNMGSKAGSGWRENIGQVRRLLALGTDADLDAFTSTEGIEPVRAYDLSKETVIAWTKGMTGSLAARGIRMNSVSPAAIDTPILGDFVAAFGERAERGLRLTGRPGTAGEVAEVVVFLASPAAAWVSGCNVETDGGLAAQIEADRLGLSADR